MAKTVVGLMDTPREAESVVRDLAGECGCNRNDIGLMARGEQTEARGAATPSDEGGSEVGSGAGSDAFDLTVTDTITERAGLAPKTQEYIARRTEIDYATYVRFRGKLAMK